ncbi:protease pro-enzyme activation domain-containing protein [Chromobacterium sp. IIBBL 290-4]|uniref:S53 family peptidase n=1 Tax=Chromobacterium sp. IIBBL 290-4 TaxID=2953890 RepID=UPI0020B78B80|nr:S53 family peptidase [Chromobacterium sp. IIBBL 290-4]UTH72585.1 S53 family peptidase [Chromobacterium sp. IIBBL 290-4]
MAFPLKLTAIAVAIAAASSASIAASALDLGKVEQAAPAQPLTVTIALPLRDRDAATRYLLDMHTQGSANFHKFLTPAEFRALFAPSDASVARVSARLQAAGLNVKRVGSALLQVSGPAAVVQKAFGAEVHVFQKQASSSGSASRFISPVKATAPSVDLSDVQAVIGLDSRPHFRPHIRQLPNGLKPIAAKSVGVTAGNAPGQWTVTDLARHYDITPLYNKGIHGQGATIGIVTLASFTPSDAFQYWNQLGLKTDPNRLSVVDIDGGPGAPSDEGGSDETTLDVEQSGGVAPGAKIIVYQAPNTTQGFVDAFAQAIESNAADTLSVSWGEWEWFDDQAQAVNPVGGKSANVLQVYHDLFLQAALQGQTMFAAAGDSGAYDVNRAAPLPQFNKVLSVDSPANQSFITAAGGTTVPATLTLQSKDGKATQVKIPTERAWGWDYLSGFCQAAGKDPVACGIFPVGGGGGVSAFINRPFYQSWIPHMLNSPAGQQLVDSSQTPPQVVATVPGNFKGRNLPDVSLNADPETGYVMYYTSSQNGFGILANNGGTSFVAPQLAGITALLNQSLGSRIGLLNLSLYSLLATGHAYHGFGHHGAPFREVSAGGNWGYNAHRGYNQATGIGVPNVANLDAVLKRYFF